MIEPGDVIRALETQVDVLAGWLAFWTALVVLGLMFEYGAAVATWSPWKVKNPLSFFWVPMWVFIGGGLIVGGVAGELYVEFVASRAEHSLREYSDATNAALERAAREADKQAKQLEQENLKLKAAIKPRELTKLEANALLDTCRRFPGHTIKIRSYLLDSEGLFLAVQILRVLRQCKATTVLPDLWTIMPGITTLIVGVRVDGPPLSASLSTP